MKNVPCLFFLGFCLLLTGCGNEEELLSPKPRGYFRIDLPEKKYTRYEGPCPFSFDIPAYSKLVPNPSSNAEPCWQNLEFSRFGATVYLCYKPILNNIPKFLDEAHEFANRHQIQPSGLDQTPILMDSSRVYGLLFDIGGNTASALQFYITDSTRHFLRGSLYFNCVPNSDSLKLVIDFLRQDILHLLQSTRWKETKLN